jgi:hypothetical protein
MTVSVADDDDGVRDLREEPIQPDEQRLIEASHVRSLGNSPLQNVQLVAKDCVFGSQLLGRPKAIFNERPQQF